jgi:hypothetical protein
MLTVSEMTDARDKLKQADSLIAAVRGIFLTAGDVQGARVMNDIIGLIADRQNQPPSSPSRPP